MDLMSIKTALDGLKVAKDVFTGFNEIQSESDTVVKINEAVKKVGNAQDTLYDLREELYKLQEENNLLKRQISSQESWGKQINQYELIKTEGGAVVYQSTKGVEHFICPSCIVKKEIQPLQNAKVPSGRFDCPGCNKGFPVNISVPPVNDFAVEGYLRG